MKILRDHPFIYQLFELYETKSFVILITEHLFEGDLYTLIKQHKRFSEKEVIRLLSQLTEALHYLNQKNIIHRDIKLENVKLTSNQLEKANIRLSGFGISVCDKMIEVHDVGGTPGYIAPEILLNQVYNAKSDVFSLGILIYTLLFSFIDIILNRINGSPPFIGSTVKKILTYTLKKRIAFNTNNWIGISSQIKKTIQRMTEKKPQLRIDIEELHDLIFVKKYLDFNNQNSDSNYSSKLISFESSQSDYTNSIGLCGIESPIQDSLKFNSYKSLFKDSSAKNLASVVTDKLCNSMSTQLKNQNLISTTIQDQNNNESFKNLQNQSKQSENLIIKDKSPVELYMASIKLQKTKFISDINKKFCPLAIQL